MHKKDIIEKVVLFFISLSFFVGLWHAFPFTNVIADEMYFVGGVMRSIENHSIFPNIYDVPYGTVTFLLNYIVFLPILFILFVYSGFNISELKILLLRYPEIMYLVSRMVSAFAGVILLLIFNKFLKKFVEGTYVRLCLLVILFGNLLVNFIFHTGKVWVLSTLFFITSFIFVYLTIDKKSDEDHLSYKKYALYSILLSFLAFANFPIMAISLISLLILLFTFRNDVFFIKKIVVYALCGGVVFLLISLINIKNISLQIDSIFGSYLKNPNILSVWDSLILNMKKVFVLFPVSIAILFSFYNSKLKNVKLFNLSLFYLFTYFVIISFVARWSLDINSFYRYLFPIPFFLMILVVSFEMKTIHKVLIYIGAMITLVFLIFNLYKYSQETTYNETLGWLYENSNADSVLIINKVGADLDLPKNSKSYSINKVEFCSTKCVMSRSGNFTNFRSLVEDASTMEGVVYKSMGIKDTYLLSNKFENLDSFTLVHSFISVPNDKVSNIADNIGNYFDEYFFTAKKFGKNVYIYKK